MRFIRDIITERAEGKAQRPENTSAARAFSTEPEIEAEATAVAENAPMPVVRPATPRLVESGTPDRTMTRLSEPWSLDDDDVFKRLLGEESAQDETETQAEPEQNVPDDGNVFDDWDMASDAAEAEPAPLPPLSPEPEGLEPLPMDDAANAEEPQFNDMAPPPLGAVSTPPRMQDRFADTHPEPVETRAPTAASDQHAEPGDPVVAVPAPATGRSGRSAGRVKTRLLGFGTTEAAPPDPFSQSQPAAVPTEERAAPAITFPVGWLVVISGPGRGASFPLHSGVSQIGRGDDQAIRLDFGDTSISRSNHAAIAYDEEQDSFYLGHGGKANMVRLNDRPVLSTEDVRNGALIRIGETTLRFVAFCDGTFNWSTDKD